MPSPRSHPATRNTATVTAIAFAHGSPGSGSGGTPNGVPKD